MSLYKSLVTSYSDGSTYPKNPGNGGYSVIFVVEKGNIRHIKTVAKYFPAECEVTGDAIWQLRQGKKRKPFEKNGKTYIETTNNRMEIGGVIEAMSRVKKPEETKLIVYSDSQWAINMANGTWVAKENKDLVTQARKLAAKFCEIEFRWVRGHEGHRWNEWCDQLAYHAVTSETPEDIQAYQEEIK